MGLTKQNNDGARCLLDNPKEMFMKDILLPDKTVGLVFDWLLWKCMAVQRRNFVNAG